MFFTDIVNRDAMPVMEKMLAFTQARHRMLVENVANADTPGYVTKQLDASSFQRALQEAGRGPDGSLRIRPSDEFRQDANGHLMVTPTAEPAGNILFHDGTNMRIEQQMSMLAENAVMHQTVTEMYRMNVDGLLKAIRGTVK